MSDKKRTHLYGSSAVARVLAGAVVAALVATLTVILPATPAAAAPRWSQPVTVSAHDENATDLKVVESDDGTRVAAVWEQHVGLDTYVRVATSANGGAAWRAPNTLGPGDEPQIVMSDDGQRITVLWWEMIEGDYLARVRSSSDGGTTWTAAQSISLPGYRVGHLRMAASDNGMVVTVAWEDVQSGTTPGTQRVRVTTSADGGATWSTPREVTKISDYQGKSPAVTVSADGQKQTVVWLARGQYDLSVFTRSSSDGGATWSPEPVRITWMAGNPRGDTVVESSADGEIVTAVWRTYVFSTDSIVASTSVDSGKTWSNWRLLGDGHSPALTHDAEGKQWTAVWNSTSGESSVEAALTLDRGQRWSERTVLAAADAEGTDAVLAESPNGERLTALWQERNGHLFAAGSDDGGEHWEPSARVTTETGATSPAVAGSSTRAQVAVWAQDSGVQAATAHYRSQQTIQFPQPPEKPQFSAGKVQLRATASSGLEPTYTSNTPAVCSISETTAVPVKAGRCTVTANQPGNADYEAASPVQRSFEFQRSNQRITFPPVPAIALADHSVALKAHATSQLPIVYRSETKLVCSIEGATAIVHATGQCVVTATQPGSGGYFPADEVMRVFEVKRNSQEIEFAVIANKPLTVGTVKLRARSTSGLPVRYTSLTEKVCSVDGDTLRLLDRGSCTVRADQDGDSRYAKARSVTRSFLIVANAPKKPEQARFGPNSAKRTVITWNAGSENVTGYAVRIGGKVRCRTAENDRKCTVPELFGPRIKVTVTAYNKGVASAPVVAKYRASQSWIALGRVDFPKKSAVLGKGDKKLLARRAALLSNNGFKAVLVTGQTARSEPHKLAARRAKATGSQLRKALKRVQADVKVSTSARAGQRPVARQAVLWVR